MDDGHLTAYNQTVLNTNSYTYPEIIILQQALLKIFKLRTRTTSPGVPALFPNLNGKTSPCVAGEGGVKLNLALESLENSMLK